MALETGYGKKYGDKQFGATYPPEVPEQGAEKTIDQQSETFKQFVELAVTTSQVSQ